MRSASSAVARVIVLGTFSCATTGEPLSRTIEPPSGGAPASAAVAAAATSSPGPGPGRGRADSDFVLSRDSASAAKMADPSPLHVGDKWWPFRAEFLKLREAEASERDAAISERQAPTNFWD